MIGVGIRDPSAAGGIELKHLAVRAICEDLRAAGRNIAIEGVAPAAAEPGRVVVERVESEAQPEAVRSAVDRLLFEFVAVGRIGRIAAAGTRWAVVVAPVARAVGFHRPWIAHTVGPDQRAVCRTNKVTELHGAPVDVATHILRRLGKAPVLRSPKTENTYARLIGRVASDDSGDIGQQRQIVPCVGASFDSRRISRLARRSLAGGAGFEALTAGNQIPSVGRRVRYRWNRFGGTRQQGR